MSPGLGTAGPTVLAAAWQLVDEPVDVRVVGVKPGRVVRVHARCADAGDRSFTSWADYRAGPDGVVEPGIQAALAGTHRGVDPYGLWWSMSAWPEACFAASLSPLTTEVCVEAGGRPMAAATLTRQWLGPGVEVQPAGDGVAGDLFLPSRVPAPGVVVLAGSEGGREPARGVAALLASRGFVALALAYFGEPGLPTTLVRVPLESLEHALSWLARHPAVAGDRVAVAGTSRGGELALLAGATFSVVGAVVGWAASGVVWTGLAAGGRVGGPAWTWRGKALSFATPVPTGHLPPGHCIEAAPSFAAVVDRALRSDAVIPVERIRGPLLLISGGDDRMWPATTMADAVVRRLAQRGHRFGARHLWYPRAGHLAGRPPGLPLLPRDPPHPVDGRRYALGGTAPADAASAANAWPRVVAFLHHALTGIDPA